MSTNIREYIKPMIKELELRGMKHSLDLSGKHAKLQFKINGKIESLVFPKTPSDRRGWEDDKARLRRWLAPIPLKSKPVQTKEPKMQEKPAVAHVRFGIQSDGRLSATFPKSDLAAIDPLRAKITRSSMGKVIFNFVLTGGSKGTITTSDTINFTFSRSKVDFVYGTTTVHGRSTPELLGRFINPTAMVLDNQLPEAILQLNKPKEPRLPFKASKTPDPWTGYGNPATTAPSKLPRDILQEGKELRELFNDWIERAVQAGCAVTTKIEDNKLRVFASKPVEL